MYKILLKLFAFCLSFFVVQVHAEEWDTVTSLSVVDNSERNAHFMLAFGRTDIKGNVFHHQGSISKLQGGYRFSDYLIFEAGFSFYGEAEDEAGTADQEITGGSFETQFLLIAPLMTWFEPYGKLGISSWFFDTTTVPVNIDSGNGEYEGSDLIYGAGFLFNIDHDSTLRLEYEMSSFKDAAFDVDVKEILFAIQHRF